jgi:dTDP-4-dehydrorhamnose 3,5-epimerase
MRVVPIELPDVVRIVPTVHEDARGHFMETWQARRFFDAGIDLDFV